jgi:hypothetical protein
MVKLFPKTLGNVRTEYNAHTHTSVALANVKSLSSFFFNRLGVQEGKLHSDFENRL